MFKKLFIRNIVIAFAIIGVLSLICVGLILKPFIVFLSAGIVVVIGLCIVIAWTENQDKAIKWIEAEKGENQ